MTRIKDIIQHLESIAPLAYQESYDNSGLLTGNAKDEVTTILISLDVTEQVVEEAIELGANLIVAHHPIIFKGLKSLTGKNYVERTVIKAIKNDIAIYAIHTNLDNVHNGVNKKICDKLGLVNTKILAPKSAVLSKLVTFIPVNAVDKVKDAMFNAGSGGIGNYSECSFTVVGDGEFKPDEGSNPTIGRTGMREKVAEARVEIVLPSYLANAVINSLKNAHPYEEVAYYLSSLDNKNQQVGSGMIGELNTPLSGLDFMHYLKDKMALNVVKHTQILDKKIKKVAVCGGSGSFLLPAAKSKGADIFITSDYKYHEFFDADGDIIITDIGHYESEVYTKDLIYDILSEKFSKFALNLSKTVTNPISYL
uniref:Nif3-like dinuclear metal center hexameric protein n=1 Tax=Fulvivirga sp. TaxID=1931237 RepID=UPI00404B0CF4